MRIPRAIGFILVGIYISQLIFYYPGLPEYVASNFDGSGNPQAWMSKTMFYFVGISVLILPFLVFLFLPKLLANTPAKYLNIPNKDYWLAKDRKDVIIEKVSKYYEWIFVGIMVFTIIVSQMVIRANIGAEGQLSEYFIIALIVFILYVLGMVVLIFVSFRKPG